MSLDVMRDIVKANTESPDQGLIRVRAFDMVAACDEIPEAKRDRKHRDIRAGSAKVMSEIQDEERREAVIVIVQVGFARHLLKLAG